MDESERRKTSGGWHGHGAEQRESSCMQTVQLVRRMEHDQGRGFMNNVKVKASTECCNRTQITAFTQRSTTQMTPLTITAYPIDFPANYHLFLSFFTPNPQPPPNHPLSAQHHHSSPSQPPQVHSSPPFSRQRHLPHPPPQADPLHHPLHHRLHRERQRRRLHLLQRLRCRRLRWARRWLLFCAFWGRVLGVSC